MKFNTKTIAPFGALVEALNADQDVRQIKITNLREIFESSHLLVLRGFKSFKSTEEFIEYCELWGEISLWPFGKVLELIEQENPQDHIFDHNYVPLHWDGMYRPQVPELQIFRCVKAPLRNHGGRTTFSNTKLVLERASQKDLEAWSKVTGVYERKMEFYQSKTMAPLITPHPSKDFPVIRYCEPPKAGDETFINHPSFEFQGADNVPDFRSSLEKALYAPENFYAHEWQTGDLIITDNYTLLHGREAFTSGSPRHLQRVHVLGNPALNNPHLVSHV